MPAKTRPQATPDPALPQLQAYYEHLLERGRQARKRARLDALNQPTTSLQAAGLEPAGRAPLFGYQSVPRIVEWFSDGEDSRYTA